MLRKILTLGLMIFFFSKVSAEYVDSNENLFDNTIEIQSASKQYINS